MKLAVICLIELTRTGYWIWGFFFDWYHINSQWNDPQRCTCKEHKRLSPLWFTAFVMDFITDYCNNAESLALLYSNALLVFYFFHFFGILCLYFFFSWYLLETRVRYTMQVDRFQPAAAIISLGIGYRQCRAYFFIVFIYSFFFGLILVYFFFAWYYLFEVEGGYSFKFK